MPLLTGTSVGSWKLARKQSQSVSDGGNSEISGGREDILIPTAKEF